MSKVKGTLGNLVLTAAVSLVAFVGASAVSAASAAAFEPCFLAKVPGTGDFNTRAVNGKCEEYVGAEKGEYVEVVAGSGVRKPNSPGEWCYKVTVPKDGNHEVANCTDAKAPGGEYIEVAGPVWELNGAVLEGPEPASTEGFLELTDEGVGTTVRCEGALIGDVGPYGEDEITEVEGPNGEKSTGTTPIECQPVAGLCENEVEVTPVNLPWETELYYGSNGEYRDRITNSAGDPGYTVECKTFLGKIPDTCTGDTSTEVLNITGGVEGIFDEASENGDCTLGGAGTGKIRGKGATTSPPNTLSISLS